MVLQRLQKEEWDIKENQTNLSMLQAWEKSGKNLNEGQKSGEPSCPGGGRRIKKFKMPAFQFSFL